jgi:PAS domain-containing protein
VLGVEANRANATDAAEFHRTTRLGADGVFRVAPPVDPTSEAVFWIPPGHPLDPFWKGLLARGRMVVSQFGLGTAGESLEDVWFLTTSGGEVVYMPEDPSYADRPATAGYDASAWIDPVRPENNAAGQLRWLPAQRSPRPPLWYATVVAPVSGRGRFLGAVGIDISIGQVVDQSGRLPTGPGHAHLIVEPGDLITYGRGAGFERALTDSITVGGLPSPLRDSLAALLGRVRQGQPGVVSSGSVGATMMLAARLGRADWTVVTLIEKAVVAAPLRSPLRLMRLALAAVLLLLLAAVVAVVAADARRRRSIDTVWTRASERFNQLFELMPVSVALARVSTGEFIEVNDAACRISGIPRERFIGATTTDLGLWSDAEEGARRRFAGRGASATTLPDSERPRGRRLTSCWPPASSRSTASPIPFPWFRT